MDLWVRWQESPDSISGRNWVISSTCDYSTFVHAANLCISKCALVTGNHLSWSAGPGVSNLHSSVLGLLMVGQAGASPFTFLQYHI